MHYGINLDYGTPNPSGKDRVNVRYLRVDIECCLNYFDFFKAKSFETSVSLMFTDYSRKMSSVVEYYCKT